MKILLLAAACFLIVPHIAAGDEPFQETDIFISGEDNIAYYRIPALTVSKEGTVLAVCDGRVERLEDAPNNIDLVMRRSFDNGRTWSSLETILDYPGDEAACDPCIFTDRVTGAVWIFFDYAVPRQGLLRNRKIWLYAIRSDDEGETWSDPVNLSAALPDRNWHYIAAAPGTAIQISGGRLIVPTYSVRSDGDVYTSHIVYSDNHGKTWNLGPDVGNIQCEPQVVELANGALLMNMRQVSGKRCRGITFSHDGGNTWSEVGDDKTLIEPVCQASIIHYTASAGNNSLLFSNPASAERRVAMTVRSSNNGGIKWPVSKLIHGGPAAYSCMAVLADGSIGLLYERGEKSPYEKITFARFTIDWLTGEEK